MFDAEVAVQGALGSCVFLHSTRASLVCLC